MAEPLITKEQFIDGWVGGADAKRLRTEDGYTIDNIKYVALRCRCGETDCPGWAMIIDDRGRGFSFSVYEFHLANNKPEDESDGGC